MTRRSATRSTIAAAAAVSIAVVLGACGSSDDSSTGASSPSSSSTSTMSMPMTDMPSSTTSSPATTDATTDSGAAATITIKDFGYSGSATVKPGQKITVTNLDTEKHTVTSDTEGVFDVAVDGRGGTATLTAPSKPGTYTYYCTFHSNMHGTLVVK